MKYVLVLLVVMVAAWVLMGRSRGRADKGRQAGEKARSARAAAKPAEGAAQAMVMCAHCHVHLPQSDSVADAQGRRFCDDAHRLAGPR